MALPVANYFISLDCVGKQAFPVSECNPGVLKPIYTTNENHVYAWTVFKWVLFIKIIHSLKRPDINP